MGRAAAAAHLDPAAATGVIGDVRLARQCLILQSDLHLLFLCVPPDAPAAMDVEAAETKFLQRGTHGTKTETEATAAPPAAAAATAAVVTAVVTASTTGPGVAGAAAAATIDSACRLNVNTFLRVYDRLTAHEQRVAFAVGVLVRGLGFRG